MDSLICSSSPSLPPAPVAANNAGGKVLESGSRTNHPTGNGEQTLIGLRSSPTHLPSNNPNVSTRLYRILQSTKLGIDRSDRWYHHDDGSSGISQPGSDALAGLQ